MARKTFLNGYPLPASDLNTYLMDQTVQTYADATARTAALATPTEGQMSYLADQNTAYVYDGSSWNAVVDAKNYGATLPNGAAGKNKIINGGFDIWARGTSFTPTSGAVIYTADRFLSYRDGSGATVTVSQQTFTPGTAPVAGYEGQYYHRHAQTVAGTGGTVLYTSQRIEDCRTFAGQTVTVSFWAKADATRSLTPSFIRNYGSGGSGGEYVGTGSAISLTTSWVRYTQTFAIPSVAGKTIGSSSSLELVLQMAVNTAQTIDLWGVQLEAGSVATPFSRAAGTLQGELAACQRYYWRNTAAATYTVLGTGASQGGTSPEIYMQLPVTGRAVPTSVEYSTLRVNISGGAAQAVTSIGISSNSNNQTVQLSANTGSAIGSVGQIVQLQANNNSAAYVALNMEL